MTDSTTSPARRWSALAHNVIGVGVLIGFAFYLWQRRAHFASVLDVSFIDVVWLCLIVIATWVATTTQAWLLFRAAGLRIGFWENLVLGVATAFGNYLPARLGTLVRAHYLKARHGMRYARFVSVTGMRTVLVVMATGLSGVVGTIGVALGGGPLSVELLLLFGTFAVVPVLAWLWHPPARDGKAGRIRRIVHDFAEGFAELRARPATSAGVLALVLLQYAALALRFSLASRATGADVSVAMLMLLAPLAAMVSFAAITPGGLGLREAVMGYASYATGASFSAGLYVGTVDRAVLLGMMAVFGSASFVTIWVRVRRAQRIGTGPTAAPPEPTHGGDDDSVVSDGDRDGATGSATSTSAMPSSQEKS